MSKPIPTTKEQLVYFLYGNISLGTYDRKFISNLVTGYITPNKPVTTNQDELLNKIITRYARQLQKYEIDIDRAVKLNWTLKPIQSLPKYTQAHITLNEGSILVHSPFKQEFVKEFREMKHTVWDKEEKTWFVPYTELFLKQVIKLVNKHYGVVNYCDSIKEILKSVDNFTNVKYWNPTLINLNNRLIIAASNAHLDEAIKHIELNIELPTIARLAYHGITIDSSVIDMFPLNMNISKIVFAIERHSTLDFDTIVDLLETVKTDLVILSGATNSTDKELTTTFKEILKEKEIPCKVVRIRDTIDVRDCELPIIINGFSFTTVPTQAIAKVITLQYRTNYEAM